MSKFFAGQTVHVVPLLAPVDIAGSATSSDIVGVKEYLEIEFLVELGVITGDEIVVTVLECDDTTPSNSTAIPFKYRKTSAVGTDLTGALTAATAAAGATMSASDDGKSFLIEVDPAALTDGFPYLKVTATPGGSASVCLIAVQALLRPRYPQDVQISAVD